MSWRTVVITTRCKLDLKMGFMVIRGEETKRVYLDEIAVLMIENAEYERLSYEKRITIDKDLCEF
ncbi:MAG: hypothetical protein MJ090_05930 [Clostridia bacterium]|nr:hypothetical protein [Clostridia bacterium]